MLDNCVVYIHFLPTIMANYQIFSFIIYHFINFSIVIQLIEKALKKNF